MPIQSLFPIGFRPQQSYKRKVLTVKPGNLLAYYAGDDAAGANRVSDRSGHNYHGTPRSSTQPTLGTSGIGDGSPAIQFNSTEYFNLLTSGLQSVINGAEGSVALWYTVDSSILTDGAAHYMFYLVVDGSNQIWFRKQNTNNQFAWTHLGGGTAKSAAWLSTSTGWQHVVYTWSFTNGIARIWLNGEPGAGPAPGLGTFTGTPTTFLIGASTTGGSSSWRGKLAHMGVWSTPLTVGDIAVLARKNGQVIFDGDSRTQGTTSPYPNQMMALGSMTPKNYSWYNSGVSGQTILQMDSSAPTEVDAQHRNGLQQNIVVLWGGVNDGNAGADMTTIYNRIVTYCQARKAAGFKVVVCTEIDSRSTQSEAVNWHTNYPSLNTMILNNWQTFADGVADLGADARLQDANNTTYFADLTHLNTTGYGVVASIIAPVVAGLG